MTVKQRRARLTNEEKNRIVKLKKEGQMIRDICESVQCNQSTVHRVIRENPHRGYAKKAIKKTRTVKSNKITVVDGFDGASSLIRGAFDDVLKEFDRTKAFIGSLRRLMDDFDASNNPSKEN